MTSHELNDIYFNWMQQLVCDDEYTEGRSYYKLFRTLLNEEFYYILPMDGNRAEDGIDLRYRFGYEHGIDERIVATELDYKPCSILEMLVALVVRFEEHIMVDPDHGDRFGRWFWTMIDNMGLLEMDDAHFSYSKTHDILNRFLERQYGPHGEGGLVYLPDCTEDLRRVDIWCQVMWYLSSTLE